MLIFVVTLTLAFVVLFGFFALLEHWFPGVRGQRRVRAGFRTDVVYWFLFSPVSRAAGAVGGFAALVVAAGLTGTHVDADSLRALRQSDGTAIGRQPLWLQVLELLLVADFTGYWTHRAFHRQPRLWPFHAIHHSSVKLDWLSAVRVHPVNETVATFAQALPLLLLGFQFQSLGPFAAVLTMYAIFVHANLPWTFGPLRYVVASPVFHRWHHTIEREGLDKNFAGLFPLWDLLFGTFHMPADRQPSQFGVLRETVPDGPFQQLTYPFRPRRVLSGR